jgi:LAS superfamily LD-carboxypeptidase LdcB
VHSTDSRRQQKRRKNNFGISKCGKTFNQPLENLTQKRAQHTKAKDYCITKVYRAESKQTTLRSAFVQNRVMQLSWEGKTTEKIPLRKITAI